MIESVFLIIIVASLLAYIATRTAAELLIRHHHAQKTDFFERYPVQPGDIVFAGDSITDGARWDELFPHLPVKNRGINADTTAGLLQRLGNITSHQPAAVFLLIGTNDLPWYGHRRTEKILETYQAIVDKIKDDSPQTRIFIQSILPRAHSYARYIRQLNLGLQNLAARSGCTYIDLHSSFSDSDGQMLPQFSNDQLHLLAAGYERWVRLLEPHLASLTDETQEMDQRERIPLTPV